MSGKKSNGKNVGRDKGKSNRWIFVFNNPGNYEPVFDPEHMAYMVYQMECGEQGTMHWQGYVRFGSRKRLAEVTRFFERGVHLEVARGDEAQCKAYCTKEETRVLAGKEQGIFDEKQGRQGRRVDLELVAERCKQGASLKDIATEFPVEYMKFHAGIAAVHSLTAPKPPVIREVKVQVWWGPTGVGKSYRAATLHSSAFHVNPGRDAFGSYRGETTIVFEEFDSERWDIFSMNRYLDQYRLELDCRYRNIYAAWTLVIIISNIPPLGWYPSVPQSVIQAFRRRLGSGCRHVVDREQDIDSLPADPDFSKDV